MNLTAESANVIGVTRTHEFAQVDVFSDTPYRGNPVAVILNADNLEDDEMQQMATWTNLSETTFVLRPTHPRADYRVRIFTPGGELLFGGHPTLGSAHAWLEAGGAPQDGSMIVQECSAGLVDVRNSNGALAFAAPPTIRDGDLDEAFLERISRSFGIAREQILAHQWVDNGPGWAVVRLATAQEVLDLEPDLSFISDDMVGAIGAYPEGSEFAFEMRSFAPRVGVAEDPVCGGMNASVGQWLTRTNEGMNTFRVSQGARLGRYGDITITAEAGRVWVGGNTVTCFRGTATT